MYLFFMDESGSRHTRRDAASNPYLPNERFYVLLACGILEHYWHKFDHHINEQKRILIGRVNDQLMLKDANRIGIYEAEIKSHIVRRRKERNSRRFWQNLTDGDVASLVKSIYTALEYFKMEICAAVIDKQYCAQYMDWQKLHRKSYELVLERVQNLMLERHPKHKAIIIFDDAGPALNQLLVEKHDYFLTAGTSSGCRLKHIVQSPLFVGSHLANGIQVSDICAYNVYRAFVDNDFSYKYFQRILPYFYRSENTPTTKVDGLKVFPPDSPIEKCT